jgi:HSP20 family protein
MTSIAPRPTSQLTSRTARQWDPVREVEDLQDRMGQLLQSFFGEPVGPGAGVPGRTAAWLAPVDIEETEDAFVVDIDLPNVRKEDVQLELRDNTLRVFGEIKKKERTGILRRQTRRVGEFEYLVALPGEVNPDNVDATLHDGVLTVRIGKASASKPRRIEVKD